MQKKLDAFSSSKTSASSTHPQAPAQGRQGSRLVYLLTSKIQDKEAGEEGAVPGHDRPSIKRVREEEGVPTPTASVRGAAPSYLHLALQPVTSGATSRPRPAHRRATKPPNPGGMLVLGGLPNVLAPQQKPFWQAEELTARRRPVTLPAFNHYTDSLAHGVCGCTRGRHTRLDEALRSIFYRSPPASTFQSNPFSSPTGPRPTGVGRCTRNRHPVGGRRDFGTLSSTAEGPTPKP